MKLAILYCLIFMTATAAEMAKAKFLYKHISNICQPTYQEMCLVQEGVLNWNNPLLNHMPQTGFIMREFRFIGSTPDLIPESGRLVLNCTEQDLENCIIIYASFNHQYPKGLKRLLKQLSESDFRGHVYYRIGGWPNIEAGDLQLVHVPFAFKPCFFKEVQHKGYKKVLWLDSSVLLAPNISLNFIFEMIERMEIFIQKNTHTIERFMNPLAAQAFGITMDDTKNMWSCSAAIIGLNLKSAVGRNLLDAWYTAAHHSTAFFSDRSDQNALSILLYQQGLTDRLLPIYLLGSISHPVGNLFLMDRTLVKTH